MDKISILLADDDAVFLKLTSDMLVNQGYVVDTAEHTIAAQRLLQLQKYDIMMLDMCFPSLQDGFDLLDDVHAKYPNLPILMISASAHIPDAVMAIKKGAVDFVEKPLDVNHMLLRLQRLGESISLSHQMHNLQLAAIGMKGNSSAMHKVFAEIIMASQYTCPVFINGETGVGKELAANAIHRLSPFKAQNMVTINCASIPKELFEAELFGFEKGSFTGAMRTHRGYFEFAHGTSFFLDEISELPWEVQAKLLRVISEGEIQKVGGGVSKITTRLISATNQNLPALISQGKFREDLYYRLNTIQITIPPLRNRVEDIPVLAEYFLLQFCSNGNIPPKTISPTAIAWLCEQPWPGNARELKDQIERVVIFTNHDTLSVADFTSTRRHSEQPSNPTFRETMRAFEKAYLEKVLKESNYNISQAARQLRVDKSNLSKKITQLGIIVPPK